MHHRYLTWDSYLFPKPAELQEDVASRGRQVRAWREDWASLHMCVSTAKNVDEVAIPSPAALLRPSPSSTLMSSVTMATTFFLRRRSRVSSSRTLPRVLTLRGEALHPSYLMDAGINLLTSSLHPDGAGLARPPTWMSPVLRSGPGGLSSSHLTSTKDLQSTCTSGMT